MNDPVTPRHSSIAFTLAGAMAVALPALGQNVAYSGDGFDLTNPLVSSALGSLPATFTHVANDALGPATLAGYTVLWLDGFSTFPSLPTAQLTSFVNNGGILLVQSPGFGGNSLSEYPFGSELSGVSYAPYNGLPNGEAAVHIVNTASPLMQGLTDAGLTWASPSAFSASGHVGGAIGGFTGVADNGVPGDWVTLVRHAGLGEVVYTYQDISRRLEDPLNGAQPLDFLQNIIAVPETPDARLMAAGVAAAAVLLHRRRR